MLPERINLYESSTHEVTFESWMQYLQNPERSLMTGDFTFYIGLIVVLAVLKMIMTNLFSYCNTKPLKFIYKPSCFHESVEACIRADVGEYRPPWWYNRHVGTVLQLGSKLNMRYQNEVYEHEDGSQFVVNWYPHRPTKDNGSRICVFVPGLGSKSTDNYIFKFVRQLHINGYFCAVVCTRGLENTLTSHRVWNPGMVDDVTHLLVDLHNAFRLSPLFLAGYSAGSNIVQNVLLSKPEGLHVAGAFCCCINWCYLSTLMRLESSGLSGRMYSMLLAAQVKAMLGRSIKMLESVHGNTVKKALQRSITMSDLDRVVRRLYGFATDGHMYHEFSGLKRTCESRKQWSGEQSTTAEKNGARCPKHPPMLLLQPVDDPLHQDKLTENIPLQEFTDVDGIIYMQTSHGNHFGFMEGSLMDMFSSDDTYTYPAKVAVNFFETVSRINSKSLD